MTELRIPFSLKIVGSVAGVQFEVFPKLLEYATTQEELDKFGENMMDTVGDRYLIPMCGSAMWTVYKRYCNQDIKTFIECANTPEKIGVIQEWLLINFKG